MKTKASYFASLIFAILFQIFLIPAADAANKIMPVDMQNGAGINYERWDMGGDMWDDIHPFETGYAKDYNDLITLQKTGSAIALFFFGGGGVGNNFLPLQIDFLTCTIFCSVNLAKSFP